jgi:hypothetical protein
MARDSRRELALFATFPAVFAVFTGNLQRTVGSVPQEFSTLVGTTVEITAR